MINRSQTKIAVIGGGTGLPVLLRALRKTHADVTAIVTVADDGGSSGVIRDYVNVVPPGDIRNCLTALSDLPDLEKDIFQYRFDSDDQFFAGHAIGNLIIAALTEMKGNIFDAVVLLNDMMRINGRVYPASEEPLTLYAQFKDGTLGVGESKIATHRKPIEYVYVKTSDTQEEAVANPQVIQVIMESDMIVLGPGSLYTSILPNVMIGNLGQALCETEAEIVYICNIMTQWGETEHFTDADHVRVLHRHLKQPFIDTVLVNNEPVPETHINPIENGEYLYQVGDDFEGLRAEGCRVISADFLDVTDKGVFHDGEKVVDELHRIISRAKSYE
ncbi:gluconeogenesis factor YvcK family protein [Atopobacter phocae]|uniref:gluconeogenesis factor YvcK family protein n=1 Tax=Atopobacter phocae TaxID=136492 RepID=UPI00046F20D5|nr:uridine diphosphate-N-acetylglucosamine-binding protein YvcK [Atopobacter phocae]